MQETYILAIEHKDGNFGDEVANYIVKGLNTLDGISAEIHSYSDKSRKVVPYYIFIKQYNEISKYSIEDLIGGLDIPSFIIEQLRGIDNTESIARIKANDMSLHSCFPNGEFSVIHLGHSGNSVFGSDIDFETDISIDLEVLKEYISHLNKVSVSASMLEGMVNFLTTSTLSLSSLIDSLLDTVHLFKLSEINDKEAHAILTTCINFFECEVTK